MNDDKKGRKAKVQDHKKNPYKHKDCFVSRKKGNGARKCPHRIKKDDDNSSSISSKSNKKSIDEFEKKLKSANKQFTQLKAQIEDEGLELLDNEQSHFQFIAIMGDIMLNQSQGKLDDLDLWKVMLLDNQFTCHFSATKNWSTTSEGQMNPSPFIAMEDC